MDTIIKIRTICPNCKYTYETEYKGKLTTTKCPDCFSMVSINGKGQPRPFGVYYKKYKDAVAFGTDEKGREIAIDTKGKRIDPSETRYDLKDDPHGWKKTGKKVKGFKRE